MTTTINADNGVSSGSAGLKESADSSWVLQLQTNGTGAVTVDTSQNVGIGTTSPSQKLEVNNGAADVTVLAKTTGASYASFRVTNSSRDYSMQIRTDQSNAWVLRDETGGANRLLVDTNGSLLVATMKAEK